MNDGFHSYPAAMRELGNLDRREMSRWENKPVENSHLPFGRPRRVAGTCCMNPVQFGMSASIGHQLRLE